MFLLEKTVTNKSNCISCHGVYIEYSTFNMERNANEYSELFYHCVQVLNEYTDNISEETFLEQYFQENKVLNLFIILIITFIFQGSQ